MFRKITCLFIALTMAASIAACSSGETNTGTTEATGSTTTTADGEKTITLSTLRSDRFLEAAIEKYKEKHPEITVQVKEYAAAVEQPKMEAAPKTGGKKMQNVIMGGDVNPEDVEKYVNTLNTEIMTGKGPDIVSVDTLPYKKYADKNLLVNMSEMIEKDKSFDINKYYPNILDALKYKGSLYAFPLKFSLDLLTGDKSILDKKSAAFDDTKWTWQDFKTITEGLLQGQENAEMVALSGVDELELLKYVMGNYYDKFVDMDKKNADFSNKDFISILNLCKEMYDKKLVNTDMEDGMKNRGNTLFNVTDVKAYTDYLLMSQLQFNGNGKGYRLPITGDSSGISFSTDALYAINNNSQYKEEAWDFIKFMLSDEMQSDMGLMGFSVNKDSTKENAKRAMDAANSGKMKIMRPDGEVKLKPASEKDIETLEKLISEINRYDGADREILQIILEEAKSFFDGQKSSEEVAELIQSRVSTYLNE